jgi:dipeptidyl aminopeptidase/acylaminoacyl peptidase
MTPPSLSKRSGRGLLLGLVLILVPVLQPTALDAQGWDRDEILEAEGYVTPPREIADAALAPWYRNVTLSNPNADGSWFLNQMDDGPPPIATLAKPYDKLGGLFVDFTANRNRNLTIRNAAGIRLTSLDGRTVDVEVPDGSRVSDATWSPTGDRLAFFAHFDDATHIYVADVPGGDSRRLTPRPVLATMVTGFAWTENGEHIATVLVPDDRAPRPEAPGVPAGPERKLTRDEENTLRTYPSLLATPHDKAMVEWYATGQLALVRVDDGETTEVGDPAMFEGMDPSHDGSFILVNRMVKPFYYIVPVSSFGSVEEIWDAEGNVLATVQESPARLGAEDDDQDEEPEPRDVGWSPDGNGLTLLLQEPTPDSAEAEEEAAEEGEESEDGKRMDQVIRWTPPFGEDDRTVLYEQGTRMRWHRFSPDMSVLFANERKGGNGHTFAVSLDDPEEKHTISTDDPDDLYDDPGDLVTTDLGLGGGYYWRGGGPGSAGTTIRISDDGQDVFLQGIRYAEEPLEEGPFHFIDRVSIREDETERVYESDNDGVYERPLVALDLEEVRLVVSRESPTEVSQSYLREDDDLTRITENRNYAPDLVNAQRHTFMVRRPDGIEFQVEVTLPPDYREGTRLPAMFWFYPREYTGQDDYDESLARHNKNSFPRFGTRSIEYLTRLGYVVVQPDAPIVGEQGRMNDNYVHDLRTNLSVVIDSVDARGWVDRDRMGIGGHSYGAFSTANALVNTPFFKAGIAGDGNYNRTLTPLHFQSERRIYWEAPTVYTDMSPFFRADDLTGALLMYHGIQDQNVGTFPIHTPRMFHALNGLGKDAAMYFYPHEGHGPRARETILDLWARWAAWLDLWVMNPVEEGEETS